MSVGSRAGGHEVRRLLCIWIGDTHESAAGATIVERMGGAPPEGGHGGISGCGEDRRKRDEGWAVRCGLGEVARWAGLEPATDGLENRCSIRLSYHREGLHREDQTDK